jgi:hypothetical protein
MKRALLVLSVLFSFLQPRAYATHAAGGEIIYRWIHDSTYLVLFHFYRDCSGIPEPSTVDLCYSSTCSALSSGTISLTKMSYTPDGVDNGSEITYNCPGSPSKCTSDTSTIPGIREWWYADSVTLPGKCDHWVFSHSESARNNAVINISSPGSRNLYLETTLDNLDAPHNSSSFFTVFPVSYLSNNRRFSYNAGTVDPDNDSLYYEIVAPLDGSGCPPSSTPLTFSYPDSFSFNNVTGQMSFTPSSVGIYVLSTRVSEYRLISGNWKLIGQVTRDMEYIVQPWNITSPSYNFDASSLIGATYSGGIIYACATHPFSFDFYERSSDTSAALSVKDNGWAFGASTAYTNKYSDSVHAHFTWTPPALDTGFTVYTVTAFDSNCSSGFTASLTSAIPVFVSPVTKIINTDTNAFCPGDTVRLFAVGGGNFTWSVLPGGSPITSLSCTSCSITLAHPDTTTTYVVHTSDTLLCGKNSDTITLTPTLHTPVIVVAPLHYYYKSAIFAVTTSYCGHGSLIKWYKNGVLIKSDTSVTDSIAIDTGDVISVTVFCTHACAASGSTGSDSVVASYSLSGIGYLSKSSGVKIYPNPNKGSFTITADLPNQQNAEIQVLNTLGQNVFTDNIPVSNGKLEKQLNLINLPTGVYWLRLKTSGQASVISFTIQK